MKHRMRTYYLLQALVWAVLAMGAEPALAWSINTFNGWKANVLKNQGRHYTMWCGSDHVVARHHSFGEYGITIQNIHTGEVCEVPETTHSEYVGSDSECRMVFHAKEINNLRTVTSMQLYVFDMHTKQNTLVNSIVDHGGSYKKTFLSPSSKFLIGETGQSEATLPDGSKITILPDKDIVNWFYTARVEWAHDDSEYCLFNWKKIMCRRTSSPEFTIYDLPVIEQRLITGAVFSKINNNMFIEYNLLRVNNSCQNKLVSYDRAGNEGNLKIVIPCYWEYGLFDDGKIIFSNLTLRKGRWYSYDLYQYDSHKSKRIAAIYGFESVGLHVSHKNNVLLLDVGIASGNNKTVILSRKEK